MYVFRYLVFKLISIMKLLMSSIVNLWMCPLVWNHFIIPTCLLFLPARDLPPCLYPWNVYSVLKKINASKATGPDGIPPRLVKEFAYELSVPFTDILNCSYTEGTVPHQWKKAIVIPIPKQYPANIDKLRPVSLTDCVAKISEGFVVDWILMTLNIRLISTSMVMLKGSQIQPNLIWLQKVKWGASSRY